MALEDLIFMGTNFGQMVQGKSASVNSITLDDVKNYHEKYFTKSNLLIGIARISDFEFLIGSTILN
ncbi:MAG: hypothetical protein ACM34O_16950 [Ignavibacteria bacterium]